MKTPDEIKKGLVEATSEMFWATKDGDADDMRRVCGMAYTSMADALDLIRQLEAERDALKEALGLMVYQYCVSGTELDHRYMCAGETAFRVLGLEQYGDTSSLESWLFPECQDKED